MSEEFNSDIFQKGQNEETMNFYKMLNPDPRNNETNEQNILDYEFSQVTRQINQKGFENEYSVHTDQLKQYLTDIDTSDSQYQSKPNNLGAIPVHKVKRSKKTDDFLESIKYQLQSFGVHFNESNSLEDIISKTIEQL